MSNKSKLRLNRKLGQGQVFINTILMSSLRLSIAAIKIYSSDVYKERILLKHKTKC